MILFHIAIVCPDIYYRREATPETGRKSSFIQGNPFHSFRCKNRKDTQQMIGIIDRNSIQKNQILIRSSSPDIQATESFRSSLYTGQ